MPQKNRTTDVVLWTIIAAYTGIIYATLPLVSRWRKFLAETYGPDIFDKIYWIFGVLAICFLVYILLRLRGGRRIRAIVTLCVVGAIYAYYLTGMKYAVERIHFLEYGLLGALLLVALRRHVENWLATLQALCISYWAGLGDEAIQWMLPNRVGEIRDSVINFISAALGIALVWFVFHAFRASHAIKVRQVRVLIVFLGIGTAATALFLYNVHGFGRVMENKDPGRVFTALSRRTLAKINESGNASGHDMALYSNEALRHLFQRDFYFTNDFLIRGGGFYREYWKSFQENRVLEVYYPRFLKEHGREISGNLLMSIDKEVAEKVLDTPVLWPDTLRSWVQAKAGDRNRIFKSRVKETLITSFGPRDLIFYICLIGAFLMYMWIKAPEVLQSK